MTNKKSKSNWNPNTFDLTPSIGKISKEEFIINLGKENYDKLIKRNSSAADESNIDDLPF